MKTKRLTSRRVAGYGWLPDLPDHRDRLFGSVHPFKRGLPPFIDLRPLESAIEDQGALGSCTANALAGALELLEDKDRVPFADLSRLFIYYNERVLEGTVETDSGAMLRDGIKTLAALGVCSETKWPYDVRAFAAKPPASCYAEAAKHRITAYARLQTIDDMRSCLADGYPFVFGFTVYESFESATVARTGVVRMPTRSERAVGGHAVAAVGYDDREKKFIVRNSWGRAWGKDGHFLMPYSYLADRNLSDDFWTIRSGGNL